MNPQQRVDPLRVGKAQIEQRYVKNLLLKPG
jgi:hypothetical protein